MLKKIIWALMLVGVVGMASADIETLTVSSCTAASCSTTNYNSNTTSIGSTLGKNAADTLGWSDTSTLGGSDTIDNVYFGIRLKGDTGISGDTRAVFQSVGGATTYCLSDNEITNSVSDVSWTVEPASCSWTKARLDDLEVVITNQDGGSSTNNNYYYTVVAIHYTAISDSTPPQNNNISNTTTYTYAQINWTTDEAANGSVNYGTTTALGTLNSHTNLIVDHSQNLTSLNKATLYYYNITSCDAATNCNTTGPYNFTTPDYNLSTSLQVFAEFTDGTTNAQYKTTNASDFTNVATTDCGAAGRCFDAAIHQYLSNVATLIPSTNVSFTIAAWFNTTTQTAIYPHLWSDNGSTFPYARFGALSLANGSGTWQVDVATGSGAQNALIATTTLFSSNVERYVTSVVNREENRLLIYVNGALEGNTSLNAVGSDLQGGKSFFIGVSGTSNYLNGTVRYFSIWHRALNTTDVGLLYNGGAGCDYDLLNTSNCVSVGGDTCTYPGSGDWSIDVADNCHFTSNTDIGSNKAVIYGSNGKVSCDNNIVVRAKEIWYNPSTFSGGYSAQKACFTAET